MTITYNDLYPFANMPSGAYMAGRTEGVEVWRDNASGRWLRFILASYAWGQPVDDPDGMLDWHQAAHA